MRDIRSDLEERAKLIERQTADVLAYFNAKLEELKREHAARMDKFKAELAALSVLMESERQRNQNEPQPVDPMQETPVAETFDFQHIGDRIRRLRDGEPAPVARPG
jgi:hypothetical protein